MFHAVCLVACLSLTSVVSLPPDKGSHLHIIQPRSIDLNNAHGLTIESRLAGGIEPTGYRLELEPYLEDGVFKGHVSINVTFVNEIEEIQIHCARELEITGYTVKANTAVPSDIPAEISMDPKRSILLMKLGQKVPEMTTGFLFFNFTGIMETVTNDGFFKTTYVVNEVERIVAATQSRPTNARRIFPCFDEPRYKAPIDLSVVTPKNMVALSNSPIAMTQDIPEEPNAVWVHFERTPPMSTLSFGLVMAELVQVGYSTFYKNEDGTQIELRVWGREEYLPAIEGVEEQLATVYKKLGKTWSEPLPLKRLDVVALPSYKGVKPIDNWGLIAFKESELASKGYLLLAQELSYQFMGAFATPAWWSEVHINKALNGYLAAATVFEINSGTEMEGKWPMTVLYSLYYEFSKRYPHSRITGMKQETTSTKMELLFRMFNYTLGEQIFINGVRMFIKRKKFSTFTGDDVWLALNDANKMYRDVRRTQDDINVKNVAKSWIEKDRLPLVTVIRDYENKTLRITQKTYLRERPHDVPGADRMFWWVPLFIAREDKLDKSMNISALQIEWMPDRKEHYIHNMPCRNHFVIVNPEEIGPFPVNYDTENWNLLSNFLQSKNRTRIPELTRAKLLHDAWNLAYAGELSFATAFNMTLFLKEERHHLVWDPVFTMIDHIGRHIPSTMLGKFEAYVRSLLGPLYKDLVSNKKDDEESWRKTLRAMTKSFLCQAGYSPCIRESQVEYAKWLEAKNPDEGNPISNQYICPVFKYGTSEEWEFGLQRVINFPPSRKQSERTYLLKTLAGCPKDDSKINRLLNITLLEGNDQFSETDLFLVFSMLAGSSHGSTTLFHFLHNNWDVLQQKYRSHTNLWDSLITSATSSFTTEEGLEMVSSLYKAHQGQFASAEHIIEKSMRNIREEAIWSAENLPTMNKWLNGYLNNNNLVQYL